MWLSVSEDQSLMPVGSPALTEKTFLKSNSSRDYVDCLLCCSHLSFSSSVACTQCNNVSSHIISILLERMQYIVGSLYTVYTAALWHCRTSTKLCTLNTKLEIAVCHHPCIIIIIYYIDIEQKNCAHCMTRFARSAN